jgi:hypothetical protein
MNPQEKIFYVTINFSPIYDREFELVQEDIYKHIASGQLYRKRLLTDHGWGQEPGYIRFPEPSFEELISVLEYVPERLKKRPFYFLSKELTELNYTYFSNIQGAVSVIMQYYVSELIDFLAEKVETKYFKNRYIRRHFREFSFDEDWVRKRRQLGRAIGSKPYYRIFQEYDKWKAISHKVIKAVYMK